MKSKKEQRQEELRMQARLFTMIRQYVESTPGASSEQQARAALEELIEEELERYKLKIKEDLTNAITKSIWSAMSTTEMDKKRLVNFGEVVEPVIDTPAFNKTVSDISQLVGMLDSPGIGELLAANMSKDDSIYYIVETDQNGDKDFHIWAGHGRFSDELRRVFRSEVFTTLQEDMGAINNRQILDKKGFVEGEMLDGGKFKAYSKQSFVKRYGSDRYAEIVSLKRA